MGLASLRWIAGARGLGRSIRRPNNPDAYWYSSRT